MYEFLSIILIVFGVLQIMLFFKMWGMANDVSKIRDLLDSKLSSQHVAGDNSAINNHRPNVQQPPNEIEIGSSVRPKTII